MITSWLHHFLTKDLPVRKKKSGKQDSILEEQAYQLLWPYAPDLAGRVKVIWSSRMRTSAGLACYQQLEILLNPKLKNIGALEVDRTLRHELAHLLAQHRSGRKRIAPHGPEWRQACIDLGIPNESRTHALPFERRQQQRKFFYQCPSCHFIMNRVRKPRRKIACLACCRKYASGKYEERFQFEMITKK